MKSSPGTKRAEDMEWSWPCRVRDEYSFKISHILSVRSDEQDTLRRQQREELLILEVTLEATYRVGPPYYHNARQVPVVYAPSGYAQSHQSPSPKS